MTTFSKTDPPTAVGVEYPMKSAVEPIRVLGMHELICYHCGSNKLEMIHCKTVCSECRQLVVNCNGD